MRNIKTYPTKRVSVSIATRIKQKQKRNTVISDPLLAAHTSEFEKGVILQCREEGMTDTEISEWLKQL